MTDYPHWDRNIQAMVVRKDGEWIVAVSPMIYNDRITLTHSSQYPLFVTAGWCYDKGGAAALAAQAWNPLEEHEPAGFKKCAFDSRPAPTDEPAEQ